MECCCECCCECSVLICEEHCHTELYTPEKCEGVQQFLLMGVGESSRLFFFKFGTNFFSHGTHQEIRTLLRSPRQSLPCCNSTATAIEVVHAACLSIDAHRQSAEHSLHHICVLTKFCGSKVKKRTRKKVPSRPLSFGEAARIY